ncbi:MAG: transglycosylase domain-containing protein [bacterium]|nr:transglycosylase domain-containing protein [bacterium]
MDEPKGRPKFADLPPFEKGWRVVCWILLVPIILWLLRHFLGFFFGSVKIAAVTIVVAGTVVALSLWGIYEYDKRTDWLTTAIDLPKVADLYTDDLYEQSDVTADDGRRIACFSSPEHRIKITAPEDIPELFEKAIIAQEDKRFYDHVGVDAIGIGRAIISNFTSGRIASGASTLEMQIAKNRLLKDSSRSYTRKLKEAILALKMDREFSKREILLMYVNMPYLGRGQYGIEAGSRSYFGKPAKDLAVEEVAFVVGLINKPGLPDRARGTDAASLDRRDALVRESTKRTRHVIDRLDDMGYFDEHGGIAEYERAQAAVARLRFLETVSGCSAEVVGPYYTEEIRRRHKDKLALNTGGMQIFLPVDPDLQKVAEEALRQGLSTYRLRYTYTDEELPAIFEKYKKKLAEDLAKKNSGRSQNETDRIAADLKMTLEEFKARQIADRESTRGLAYGVDFAGRVRFMIGGEDFAKSKWNVATQGFRQPGSTFKAFTYTALSEALLEDLVASGVPEDELFKELDKRCTVLDGPVAVPMGRGKPSKWIQNFHTNSQPLYRGQITCRLAVAESRNTAAIRAGERAGVKRMVEVAKRLGLGTGDRKYEIQPYPTTAIGASDVVPIDMSAYLSFVNGGYKVPLIWEYDICKKDNQKVLRSVLYRDLPDSLDPAMSIARICASTGVLSTSYERVLHPVVAEHMKQLLQGPVNEPTGTAHLLRVGVVIGQDPLKWDPKAERIKFPFEEAGEIAAKTGTATNDNGDTSDVWFIVLVPGTQGKPETGMVMVFWMGKTTKANMGPRETGGRNLVPIAAKVMQFLKEKRGLLQPGNKFEPIVSESHIPATGQTEESQGVNTPEESGIIDPADPLTDSEKLKSLPPLDLPILSKEKEEGPDLPD